MTSCTRITRFLCNKNDFMALKRTWQSNIYSRNVHTTTWLLKQSEISPEPSVDGFRVLVIPGHTKREKPKARPPVTRKTIPPRYKSLELGKDWTNTWPTARTFNWSLVPFPVRQGLSLGEENQGIPQGKYANAELMKIPNFLHLTAAHVHKHCKALKEFCTDWPDALDSDESCREHFPVEVITKDYVADRPTPRHPESMKVVVKVPIDRLHLDYHARDKMLRLLGDRYDTTTGVITLHVDRCPLKKQNYDYAVYLLSVLYKESWKTEPWESTKTEADMERYTWDLNPSKPKTVNTIIRMKQAEKLEENPDNLPEFLKELPSDPTESDVASSETVKNYVKTLESLHDDGEDLYSLNQYKNAVKKLLLGTTSDKLS